MDIIKTKEGSALTLALVGRLDTGSAPALESVVKEELSDVTALNIDMSRLDYISSAGLRVLLSAQKTMNKQGKMTVTGANESIKEIFDMTGFSQILTVI